VRPARHVPIAGCDKSQPSWKKAVNGLDRN
jgi:hypothetical protein